VACALIVVATAEVEACPLPFETLNGPVARVELWRYDVTFQFGTPTEAWASHTCEWYDSSGSNFRTIEYSEDGSVEKKWVRGFDEQGLLIQQDYYEHDGPRLQWMLVEYFDDRARHAKYDSEGTLLDISDTFPDGRIQQYDLETGAVALEYIEECNDLGERTLLYVYEGNGDLFMKTQSTFDVDGMDLHDQSWMYFSGVPCLMTDYWFEITATDSRGNWTEKRRYIQEERAGGTRFVLDGVARRTIEYHEP